MKSELYLFKGIVNEINCYIKSRLNDMEYINDEEKEKLEKLTDEDLEKIGWKIIEDEGFNEELFTCINYYLFH